MLNANTKATGDRVVIEITETPDKNLINNNGIFIPNKELTKLVKGRIVHCGNKCKRELSIGDIVYFDKHSIYGTEGKEGSEQKGTFVLTREENVIYKVEE